MNARIEKTADGYGLVYEVQKGISRTRHGIRTVKQAYEVCEELELVLDESSVPNSLPGSVMTGEAAEPKDEEAKDKKTAKKKTAKKKMVKKKAKKTQKKDRSLVT